MIELDSTNIDRARPLLALFHHHLTVESILAGYTPGQVFVDDPAAPATAVAWYRHRVYLAGRADAAAQTAVHQLFQTIYLPDAAAAGQDAYILHVTPSWGEKAAVALPWAPPLTRTRRVYRQKTASAPQPPPAPEGFALRAVTADLLMDTSIRDLDKLTEEMLSERPSLTNFLNHSFGVCLLANHPGGERHVVGWCLSEYNSDGRCEVGIAVAEGYRRRGLATLMGRSLLATARRRGVRDAGWICWADNVPSLKTAETLGFTLAEEREVYIGVLGEAIHRAAQKRLTTNA